MWLHETNPESRCAAAQCAGASSGAGEQAWHSHVGQQSKCECLRNVVLPLLASRPELGRLAADFQERLQHARATSQLH